jgi:[FeFe] hydrogenase H-cluster maturation GTPase HydF
MTTPLSEQTKIVLFGLRNAGKSSLMNALMNLDASIVSSTPGTTTDPVTRTFELGALGPVAVTDTAGLDDEGPLGELRVEKSLERLRLSDIPVFVTRADTPLTNGERQIVEPLKSAKPTLAVVLTHSDRGYDTEKYDWARAIGVVAVESPERRGIEELRRLLERKGVKAERELSPLEGLVSEGDFLILVTPIDLAAPQGRLILPQVETIRDTLDKDCACLVVKERELFSFFQVLNKKPKLVVCDSQAFAKVAADIPADQPLTSFSILFGRKKGDLAIYLKGVKALERMPADAKVLVLESCAHHQQADDIGTVKIPRLFRQLVQPRAEFHHARQLPPEAELATYHLVINCAGCMVSRRQIMDRLAVLERLNLPVLNYGLFLAWVNGLLPRALEPFPEEAALFHCK